MGAGISNVRHEITSSTTALENGIMKPNAREAAYPVAMDNPELVADERREWGFDLKD